MAKTTPVACTVPLAGLAAQPSAGTGSWPGR